MARWEPGAAQRLQQAALELFADRGFDNTTATEIAQSVGLTERTFFRHFSDKREVLFDGQDAFAGAFLAGMDDAPPGAAPIELIAAALRSAASCFPHEHRPYARTRQAVIEANPALRERERHKLADLATTLTEALRGRGVDELPATLAAQSGVTVFGIAFSHWIREDEQRPLSEIQADVLDSLLTMAATASASGSLAR